MRNITATRLGQIQQQETRKAQQRENDRQGSRTQHWSRDKEQEDGNND